MTEPSPNLGVPDDFDLDAWIDGTCGLERTARIYQKGHLFAVLDELEKEVAVAKKIPKQDRGVDDRAPEQIQAELDAVAEELLGSAITVHVQDRTAERRRKIDADLRKKGLRPKDSDDDSETIGLHLLADAIVRVVSANGKTRHYPDGFPAEKLRAIKDRLGDAALLDAWNAYNRVTMEAPSVAAPLSHRSSSSHGGIT